MRQSFRALEYATIFSYVRRYLFKQVLVRQRYQVIEEISEGIAIDIFDPPIFKKFQFLFLRIIFTKFLNLVMIPIGKSAFS